MKCLNCETEFTGRPNKVYCCAACKKRVEKSREKVKRLITQVPTLNAEAEAAQARGDWHGKRLSLAKSKAAQAELERLCDQPIFRNTPTWLAPVITCLTKIENHTLFRP